MALSSTSMALSHLVTSLSSNSNTHHLPINSFLPLNPKRELVLVSVRATENGSGVVAAIVENENKYSEEGNGAPDVKFEDPRWVSGTWDLKQFKKKGGGGGATTTDWDAVIDAEAKRRKWLEMNPESSNNDFPVVFDTSIIPWWAWMKRFHLPEAELLNGRAAMIGFFMAYFVDGLTGVGLVDQTGNFFCKTLLFVAVSGVLLIRKNEDLDNLKKLLEETTYYDKQWQATWQDQKKE